MAAARSYPRIAVNAALDAALAALSVPLAGWIAAPRAAAAMPLQAMPLWAMPAAALALLAGGVPFRLSRQHWRFAGLGDVVAVAGAASLGAVLLTVATARVAALSPNPAFPVVLALVQIVLLAGPRIAYRQARTRPRVAEAPAADPALALLAGAGEDADLFLRALAQDRRQSLRVIGLLGFGARQTGRRIGGQPILGTIAEAGAVLDRLAAERRLPRTLVVVSAGLPGPDLAALVEEADRHGVLVRRAPQLTALDPAGDERAGGDPRGGDATGRDATGRDATGRVAAGARARTRPIELRPVEIDDLLNRAQVPLDREAMARLIQGRRIVVTGAGGTIGAELARQIAALGPERLILLDNGEYALWQIDLELGERHPAVAREALIADVRDEARIRAVFTAARPDLVFHAAALKHVPMVEANPAEGLLTNAAGTRHVADAARAAGCRAMVLISTDKAVNPTSVMGASKRLAEMYCQALDIEARADARAMRCITVRFGNVLGSTGSVVPLFQRQLARGGPLTVTHPDMRRYFMTVREAVGLVLQASVVRLAETPRPAAAPAGEQGGIFVLDMGAPVKIADLARQMIRLVGLRPDEDVEIRFTGLRPGEKLYEELFHGQEPPVPTGYPGLLMAAPRTADPAFVARAIEEIAAACRGGFTRLALEHLSRLIPEFAHNAEGDIPMTGTP